MLLGRNPNAIRYRQALEAIRKQQADYPEVAGTHTPLVDGAVAPTDMGCRMQLGGQETFVWLAHMSVLKFKDVNYRIIDRLLVLLPEDTACYGYRIDVATKAFEELKALYPEKLVAPTVTAWKRNFKSMGLCDYAVYKYGLRHTTSSFVTLPMKGRGNVFAVI